MLLSYKFSNLFKLILSCIVFFGASAKVYTHEKIHNSLVIFHPYLIKENKKEALGYLSIENTSSKSEYLINIVPQFSLGYRLWRREGNDELVEINLNDGIEIPAREAIYFDHDDFKLSFLGLDESLDWFDEHVAIFVFKIAGAVELDFEVEQ